MEVLTSGVFRDFKGEVDGSPKATANHDSRRSSCEAYFEKMQNIADQLSAIGEPITDSDLVTYILSGLGSEFNSFVVAVNTRAEPINLNDLHGLLLNHEALLNSQTITVSSNSPDPSVFYANKKKIKNPGFRFNPPTNSNQYRPSYQNKPPLLPSPSAPSTGIRYPPGQVPVCQICSKRGHTALDCWYRCDTARYPTPSPQANIAIPQPHPASSSPYQALMSTPNSEPAEGWFLDSGATHHVTTDVNNLSAFMPYTGADHLQVGNGPPHQENVGSSKSH